MKGIKEFNEKSKNNESGAALVTVLFISVLLGIACIALLSAVGSNSKNSTDVLSETKAYYAAESGLQATINVLRNNSTATYSEAIKNSGTLSTWLTYNCSGTTISIGPNACTSSGTSYSLNVTDPDDATTATTYSTVGTFDTNGTGTYSYPDASTSDRITLTFGNTSNCTITWATSTHCGTDPSSANSPLSTLTIEKVNSGAQIPSTGVKFSINYSIVSPRPATRTIKGTIKQATATDPILITFESSSYKLTGSTISLCQTSTTSPCAGISHSIANPAANTTTTVNFYLKTNALEPYRLKVLSTGYGPNGAKKQLEGIIQKNFFNDYSSPAAVTMQGTGTGLVFSWTGGGNAKIIGEDGSGSIAVTDSTGLSTVNTTVNGLSASSVVTPAPSMVTDIPDWLSTPQKFDAILSQLKITASNSGRYFTSTSGLANIGNLDSDGKPDGTGITFFDGDLNPGNLDGGGILVVKGNLTTKGDWNFKGLIIVTGAEGWSRSGGGCGTVSGGVIISPYTSTQLASNVFSLPPKYTKTGGGCSEIDFDTFDLSVVFDGTTSISNFMLGVVEK
jgi:Tfp pilus assembly protein PilX